MKICAYVQAAYSKANYKNECMETRQFAGLKVVIDALRRSGYDVEYAGAATVHLYDVVLVSLTADCDWWTYIRERLDWRPGAYKVVVGGAGLLHVTPFLPFFDYAVLGRGEAVTPLLIKGLAGASIDLPDSVIDVNSFSPEKTYRIAQSSNYPYDVDIGGNRVFHENAQGCNHKCFFCGYTWHRKFQSDAKHRYYEIGTGLFDMSDREIALLDYAKGDRRIDFSHLRNTAIDGFSERLRLMVGKPITRECLVGFLRKMIESDAKPHQIKLFNLIGLPTETVDDWWEYVDALKEADSACRPDGKQWGLVLSSNHFRPMPATPMACAPMAKKSFRGAVGKILGAGLKGGLIYQGKSLWSVEGMGTESLYPVMLSAIAHRGEEEDTENVTKLCKTSKFWNASATVRELTLEKYFPMDKLFGAYTPENLPSRYLRSYANVEKLWGRNWGD